MPSSARHHPTPSIFYLTHTLLWRFSHSQYCIFLRTLPHYDSHIHSVHTLYTITHTHIHATYTERARDHITRTPPPVPAVPSPPRRATTTTTSDCGFVLRPPGRNVCDDDDDDDARGSRALREPIDELHARDLGPRDGGGDPGGERRRSIGREPTERDRARRRDRGDDARDAKTRGTTRGGDVRDDRCERERERERDDDAMRARGVGTRRPTATATATTDAISKKGLLHD